MDRLFFAVLYLAVVTIFGVLYYLGEADRCTAEPSYPLLDPPGTSCCCSVHGCVCERLSSRGLD